MDTKSLKIRSEDSASDFVTNLRDITGTALDDLVKGGLVAKVRDGFYVLTQPITQLNQSVVLTPFTSMMLADLVNGWAEKTGDAKATGYVVNKLAITDRDVSALCQICAMLLSRDDEPESMEEEEGDDDE